MPIMGQKFCLDTSRTDRSLCRKITAQNLLKFTTEYGNILVSIPPGTDTEESSLGVPLLNGIAQCNSYTVYS